MWRIPCTVALKSCLEKSEMRADAESSSNGDVYLYINVSSCMYLEVEYITEHQNGV